MRSILASLLFACLFICSPGFSAENAGNTNVDWEKSWLLVNAELQKYKAQVENADGLTQPEEMAEILANSLILAAQIEAGSSELNLALRGSSLDRVVDFSYAVGGTVSGIVGVAGTALMGVLTGTLLGLNGEYDTRTLATLSAAATVSTGILTAKSLQMSWQMFKLVFGRGQIKRLMPRMFTSLLDVHPAPQNKSLHLRFLSSISRLVGDLPHLALPEQCSHIVMSLDQEVRQ